MTLKDIDTSQFLFNPKDPNFESKLKQNKSFVLPARLSYMNGEEKVSFEYDYVKLFTYIALMYEIKSPLQIDIPSYPYRKTKAAQIAGYKFNRNDEFDPEVEAILIGEVKEVNDAIVSYTAMQRVADWQMYISFNNLLQAEHIAAISGKPKKETIKNIKDLTAETERLAAKLFGGEEVRKMRDSLYAQAEYERLKLRSEDIAAIIEETGNVPPDFNPYGEDYVVEKIAFAGERIPQDDTSIPAARQVRSNKRRPGFKKGRS